MRLDKYSNPVFNEQDLFDALYQEQSTVIAQTSLFVERTDQTLQFESFLNAQFIDPAEQWSVEDYDQAMQSDWKMPNEYKQLDIEAWVWQQCPPWDPQHTRVSEELTAFKQRNMLNLLRWLKYFVDTCRSKNILWGVGRGSSVASYVLYLIGVHKIDSIKYNLEWQEFLR